MENPDNKFSIKKRLLSFKFAFRGILHAVSTQHNLIIHFIATLIVISLGIILKINATEWCLIVICIGLVISAELFNTAIEYLTDLISPAHSQKAGNIKDMAAGAVLICAIAASIIGLMIFLPKIF